MKRNYPLGLNRNLFNQTICNIKTKKFVNSNKGLIFENEINISNEYYTKNNIALITKRPTPINVVKVDYKNNNKITCAYFEKESTTDYNGVYKGYYVDFEAKSTKITTSFPLANIQPNQIIHLEKVLINKGVGFFIIHFVKLDEIYILNAKYVINFYKSVRRKSIPIEEIKKNGYLVNRGIYPRVDYIKTLDQLIQKEYLTSNNK